MVSQASVLNATAESMGIPLDTVYYTGDTAVAENRRLSATDQTPSNPSLRRLTTSWTITASTRVEIPVGSTTYTTAKEVYAGLTSKLDTAVSSGTYLLTY
jgi:hypothetical protein